MVMVDECHAAGLIGKTGRGTLEEKGTMGRVDIITGTLGKALAGAIAKCEAFIEREKSNISKVLIDSITGFVEE